MTKTLQDFRNELQEEKYTELNRMRVTGDTARVNLLDNEYGTEWQKQNL